MDYLLVAYHFNHHCIKIIQVGLIHLIIIFSFTILCLVGAFRFALAMVIFFHLNIDLFIRVYYLSRN